MGHSIIWAGSKLALAMHTARPVRVDSDPFSPSVILIPGRAQPDQARQSTERQGGEEAFGAPAITEGKSVWTLLRKRFHSAPCFLGRSNHAQDRLFQLQLVFDRHRFASSYSKPSEHTPACCSALRTPPPVPCRGRTPQRDQ